MARKVRKGRRGAVKPLSKSWPNKKARKLYPNGWPLNLRAVLYINKQEAGLNFGHLRVFR